MRRYVKRIDRPITMQQLCMECKMTENRLVELNELTSSQLYVGQRLIIEEMNGQEYVVQPFDTLDKIAVAFGVDRATIEAYNQIDNVFLGQKIFVPREY